MRRRDFLSAAGALAVGAATTKLARSEDEPAKPAVRQWIEIRTYHFASVDKQKAYAQFLGNAGVAAMKRGGAASPVGVFKEMKADNPKLNLAEESTDLWVIIPHNSVQAFATFETTLAADAAYQEAGKGILDAPKEAPAFDRYESMLLVAFDTWPRVIAPAERGADRVLELRTYQSRNEERGMNKIVMFNSGEIPIFTRAGMPPVFFGKAVAGPDLPHLTYMICHASMDQSTKNWSKFSADEEWKKMKAEEKYKDNVSKVVNRFLRPIEGSEI